ncbi:hypothetical protein [Staphylococcus aureus]
MPTTFGGEPKKIYFETYKSARR